MIFPKFVLRPFAFLRAKRLYKYFMPYVNGYATLLDVGCGNMLVADLLQKDTGIKVNGVDVVDINLTELPHKIFDGKKIPYKDNSLDVSLLSFVLHHVDSQKELLKEVVRVTKKRVIIIEDIYESETEKNWIKFMDVFGNVWTEPEMNFALNFHKDEEWLDISEKYKLKLYSKEIIKNKARLTRHAIYVLDKN
jgi:ubiquinone/menaquinone biosynthesis C-methylase UbiE